MCYPQQIPFLMKDIAWVHLFYKSDVDTEDKDIYKKDYSSKLKIQKIIKWEYDLCSSQNEHCFLMKRKWMCVYPSLLREMQSEKKKRK